MRRPLGLAAALLAVLALIVTACGPAAEPAALSPAQPTAAPTEAPADTSAEEVMPVPGESPVPEMVVTIEPSVTVADQAIVDDQVTIAEVVSDGAGWLVVHADSGSAPGPILGYSQVADGTNTDVVVQIDVAGATETLYAMLHTDAGTVGAWEFPDGPDVPVRVGEQVLAPAFVVSGGLAAAEAPEAEPSAGEAAVDEAPAAGEVMATPAVTVADQGLVGGAVTVAEVVSDGPGWLVIHADSGGAPGPILGYTPVADGKNSNVAVQLDLGAATSRLYAMLHQDAGTVGTWEFPGGADVPVTVNGQMVSPAFALQAAADDEAEVEIEDFQFRPKVLLVRVGTTVKWSNKDEVAHTATSDTGVWDSGYLDKGDDFFFTFTEPGTYPYYCIPHGGPGGQGMSGTVIVVE